ncbi:MAG: hypothetical protein ABGZ53_09875 [Fuerstiella sp.]
MNIRDAVELSEEEVQGTEHVSAWHLSLFIKNGGDASRCLTVLGNYAGDSECFCYDDMRSLEELVPPWDDHDTPEPWDQIVDSCGTVCDFADLDMGDKVGSIVKTFAGALCLAALRNLKSLTLPTNDSPSEKTETGRSNFPETLPIPPPPALPAKSAS